MKTPVLILILMASLFLKCKGQEDKTVEQVIDCELLITQQLDSLWTQLAHFQSTYFSDENNQNYKWNYDFEKSKVSVFKNGTPYLNIDFIHVGKIDVTEKTWTWSWVSASEEKESKLEKVKAFGLKNDCQKLKTATWSGSEKEAWEMVGITNYIVKGKGGARHYTKTEYNYVVFTKIQKIN